MRRPTDNFPRYRRAILHPKSLYGAPPGYRRLTGVLLFHAGVAGSSGGFVGVDVFFVISGYLITGLILDDISQGRFSIAQFYERRARRILPALFALLIFMSVAAYTLLMPDAAMDFGRSLVATMTFSSNVLFARQTGYFEAPAETKPLLHTWSLAVEEQFYIVYPLFLFLICRYLRKRYATILLSALVLSFAYSIWDVHTLVPPLFTPLLHGPGNCCLADF